MQRRYAGQRKDSCPGRAEQNGARFYLITQNCMQFESYALFISGIFHLIFLDWWPWETKMAESKQWIQGTADYCTWYYEIHSIWNSNKHKCPLFFAWQWSHLHAQPLFLMVHELRSLCFRLDFLLFPLTWDGSVSLQNLNSLLVCAFETKHSLL